MNTTTNVIPCTHKTKAGKPCPIHADRVDNQGQPVCHVHDPNGTYRQQVASKKSKGDPIAYSKLLEQRDQLLAALRSVATIIERTYAHDDQGERIENADSPASAADVVEELCGVEGEVFDAIAMAEGGAA